MPVVEKGWTGSLGWLEDAQSTVHNVTIRIIPDWGSGTLRSTTIDRVNSGPVMLHSILR